MPQIPRKPFAGKTYNYTAKNKKLIAAYMDLEDSSYLTLYALWKEESVSEILRNIIDDFIKNKGKKESKDFILNEVAKKAHNDWLEWYSRNIGKDIMGWKSAEQVGERWEKFKKVARENLEKRRVDPYTVDIIIERMEELEIKRI